MYLLDQYKSYSKVQPLKARILLALFITLVTLAILRALLPVGIKATAYYWFDSNNIDAEIGKIEISLFNGSFAINDISGKSDTGKNFSLGRLNVSWQWNPLFNKTVFIDHLEINSLKADAAFYKDGNMNIAGLIIKPTDKEETETPAVAEQVSTPWNVTVVTIKLSDVEFCLQQYNETETPDIDYCASLTRFDWSGNVNYTSSIQSMVPNTVPLYINGSLNLNNLAVKNNLLSLTLLDINAINIQDIIIQTPLDISLSQIGINKLTALQRHTKSESNDAQVIAFDQLSIKPLSFLELNDLKLGSIKLDGTQVYLHVDKNSHTDFAKWLPKEAKDKKDNKKLVTQVDVKDKPFNFSFDEFAFNTGKHIIFVDDSLKERFSTDIHTIALKINKLDSHTPNVPSHAKLSLKIDKHATFTIDTDLTPLANKPSMDGKGEISGLDLRMLAPYTRQYVGHNIKSGQLDAELKLGIKKGVIESNMGLALRHFELKGLSKKEAEDLNSEFGFPLNSALSLLRDKDNTIRLDIPVNGDTANPEFDPSDAVIKASSSAITSAVIQYYTPFGLVFAVGGLFDLATALNFEPVVYDPNMAVLTSAHHEQLNKLATLMIERPGVHLTLCGISNKMDMDVLFPNLNKALKKSTSATESKVLPEELIPKDKMNVLKKLAAARSATVKDYMVNQKSIKASRLIECSPEFEMEGITGVEISI